MEDFSLIILCKDRCHLLPLTLDTLKSQNGSFEVLVLDGEGSGRVQEYIDQYPDLKLRVHNVLGQSLSDMMNQAVGLARGRYIQFLEPGDRYISQHGIEYLKTLIVKEPHLIYAHSLNKGGLAPSDFITSRSPWFLKSKLFELGGFDRKLVACPSMDVLCKLRRDRKTKSIFCGRVLIDSEGHQIMPLKETCKILYRHFGLLHVLKWFLFQNRSRFFSQAAAVLRAAFRGER